MTLDGLVRPGMRVAVADGTGTPRALFAELNRVAQTHGDLRLLLGWMPHPEPGLDVSLFADARTVMSGWGLRSAVADGLVEPVPARLSAVPALLAGPLRPDLVLATVVRVEDGLRFSSEVSWLRAAVGAGVPVAAVVSRGGPHADAGPPLAADAVTVLGETDDAPREVTFSSPSPEHERICAHAAELVPEGARLQVGPGQLGAAMLRALKVPVRIDSGLLPEQVVDLDERGLLIGEPMAAYLVGGARLYRWADGRPILHGLEVTHDLGRLSGGSGAGEPFVAFNTAIEVDVDGQVNVEGTSSAIVGGIGGHPDYTAAAARSVGGLSIVAVPSTHRGRSTLVRTLSRPVTTPSHDVDVVVTERGHADLRGLTRRERSAALLSLWAAQNRPL
ncbi:acetyl-CoA hydrolase/transferase C-terminal domain-containing protein [Pseudonocardia acaciae]|uniref:acetyl-CoA hydrolase/transferase C-terminal domain-containing protein n=1 Tax=Pseudonocardia acaciae TaxID=551276 RepID=UPI000569417A|nr:acetyl-CoA hydrolase/transferase C-terminal domain-containing protein [Pseudonocardia acaciae]